MRRKQSAQNLSDISDILNDLDATHWLEGGTLLGAYRDKDFCRDDEDDVDIGIWGNYAYFIPKIIEEAEKKGLVLYNHYKDSQRPEFAQQLAFKKDRLKVDLIFYEKVKSDAVGCVFSGSKGNWHCIPRVVPSHFVENLADIDFYGKTYKAPRDIEAYLKYSYGDWKTPKHRSNYSCYNSDDLRALKPDYKI
jgi:phosphorylcholine metabolism protein LicD